MTKASGLLARSRWGLLAVALGTAVVSFGSTIRGAAAVTLQRGSSITAVGTPQYMPVVGKQPSDCVLPVVIAVECVGAGQPLLWHGGPVQTSPRVYIVYWGWTSGSDPNNEASYQSKFFNGVGGSTWNASQTQYCENTTLSGLQPTCTGPYVGNPSSLQVTTWTDTTDALPSSPTDLDMAVEAGNAATHFGNTTPASNVNAQYIIDTPTGNSTSGFGTQWCAYHNYAASSTLGDLSYTDFPYQTDAGAACGTNFVNSGTGGLLDGVSIVGGHEFAESETDPQPSSGWVDELGAETGDKCAWISVGPGTATDISLPTGTFAVQSLYSDNDNENAGGCVTYYAGASNQH